MSVVVAVIAVAWWVQAAAARRVARRAVARHYNVPGGANPGRPFRD